MTEEVKKSSFVLLNLRETGCLYVEPFQLFSVFLQDRVKFLQLIKAGLTVNYSWNIATNYFAVLLDFQFKHNENEIDTDILHYSTRTEFIVTDIKDIFLDKCNGKFEMDEQYEITFVSIAISSSRGMIAARTAGSFIGAFIYPLVNPSDHIVSKRINNSVE